MNKSDDKIEWYHIALFIGGLIWVLSFTFNHHLEFAINNCSANATSNTKAPILFHKTPQPEPTGISIIIYMICLPIEYIIRLTLAYCSSLICSDIGLLLLSCVLIMLRIIMFGPLILVGILIIIGLFGTCMYTFFSNLTIEAGTQRLQ